MAASVKEELQGEMDLRSKVKELEALVADLQGQNEVLRKENGALTTRLVEFENNAKKKVASEEVIASETSPQVVSDGMPSWLGDVIQQVEGVQGLGCQMKNPVIDNTLVDEKVAAAEGKRKKKRNATARSMSHQCLRHVSLKIMYLGTRYQGFASVAGSQRTVEAELFAALQRTRLITGTPAEAKYTRCGRTDKGVSATGQVIALYLRSKRQPQREEERLSTENAIHYDGDRVAMARASRIEEEQFARTACEDEFDYVGSLNRALPEDIRVLGWCPVPLGFSARFSCLNREYKYFFISNGLNIDAMKSACKKFEGDHDFSNFCKMDAANVHNYRRTITNFDILPANEEWGGKLVWMMKVKGTAFLWHQVRCMAAILFMVGSGHELPTIIEEMLDVKNYVRKPQYIMAPEMPLLLYRCGYEGLSFHVHHDSVKRLRLHLESLLQISIVNSSLLLQGLQDFPSPDCAAAKSIQLGDSPSRKSSHVPLRKRPTERTYEERRRMQCSDQLESTS